MRLVALVAVAAAVAATGAFLPVQAGAASACITTDSALLATVEAKIVRHGTETGRADLHEMFTKSYNTMKGNDGYTTADIKARPDKQGDNWQGAGPNELWQRVYAELDRLEQCRASLQDTTPPVITLTGSGTVTMQKGATYTDAGATCVDDTDGAISPVSSGTVDTTAAGTYTITYGCTDAAGNAAAQATRTVTVQNPPDATPPVITLTGSGTVTIQKGATYTDAGAACVDDTDGAIVPTPSGAVDTTTAGTYTITYGCTDAAGNAATQLTRSVTVQNPPTPQDTQPATPTPQDAQENLVSNGSFEAPVISGWSHVQPSTPGLAWTVSGGPLEIHHNILGGASDGAQHVELDSTGSVTISQTVSTVTGQTYTVSFDYKARPDTIQSTNGIRVTWNGADIASGITLGSTWQTHTVTVNGTGSDTISFIDAGTSDGLGTFLDNVSVVASDVPLFTGQSIQPGTSNIISFTVAGPTNTVNEGDVANFTISTTPAPTTPLDVTIRVSSPTAHVDTANHTVTIPASGSVVFSVNTIDTPIDQHGTLQLSILDGPGYLVSGIGAVTVVVNDPGSDNSHDTGNFQVHIGGPSSTVELGQTFRMNITYENISPSIVRGNTLPHIYNGTHWNSIFPAERGEGDYRVLPWYGIQATSDTFSEGANTLRMQFSVHHSGILVPVTSNNITVNVTPDVTPPYFQYPDGSELDTTRSVVKGDNFVLPIVTCLDLADRIIQHGALSHRAGVSDIPPRVDTSSTGIVELVYTCRDAANNSVKHSTYVYILETASTPYLHLAGPVSGHTKPYAEDDKNHWDDDGDIYQMAFDVQYHNIAGGEDALRDRGIHGTNVKFQVWSSGWQDIDAASVLWMHKKGADLGNPLSDWAYTPGRLWNPADLTPNFAVINPNGIVYPAKVGHLNNDPTKPLNPTLTGDRYPNVDPDFGDNSNIIRVVLSYDGVTATSNSVTVSGIHDTKPYIELHGPATLSIQKDANWNWPEAYCYDDFNSTAALTQDRALDTSSISTYTITYSCTDGSLQADPVARIVSVVEDGVSPWMGPIKYDNTLEIPVGGSVPWLHSLWCDDDNTNRYYEHAWKAQRTYSNVDVTTPGTYTEVYTCIDRQHGKWGEFFSRSITVYEKLPKFSTEIAGSGRDTITQGEHLVLRPASASGLDLTYDKKTGTRSVMDGTLKKFGDLNIQYKRSTDGDSAWSFINTYTWWWNSLVYYEVNKYATDQSRYREVLNRDTLIVGTGFLAPGTYDFAFTGVLHKTWERAEPVRVTIQPGG